MAKPKDPHTWQLKTRWNSSLTCQVPSCSRPRHGIADKWCNKHLMARKKYGVPEGKRIPRQHYWAERDEVSYLLTKHEKHVAVATALGWFDGLLKTAAGTDVKVPAKAQLRNLFDRGCTARECLHAVLSIYLFHLRRPDILPGGTRLMFEFANAVFRLRPREEKMGLRRDGLRLRKDFVYLGFTPRKELGKAIMDTLGTFLAGCGMWLQDAQSKREKQRLGLKTPLPAASEEELRDEAE